VETHQPTGVVVYGGELGAVPNFLEILGIANQSLRRGIDFTDIAI